jgi:hypothetical protein
MTISYALDFPSGKLWAAEQLDIVASRYLNRNARIVAQGVRQTIVKMPKADINLHEFES